MRTHAATLALLTLALGAGAPPKQADTPPSAPKQSEPAADAPTPVRPDNILHCKVRKDLPREKLKFLGEEWDTELCLDDTTRATGMGARTAFPPHTAMLFVYPEPALLNFWMKDCLIDMDMVFVDAEGKISALHAAKREPLRTRAQSLDTYEAGLQRYTSNRRAQFCIELPAGTIKRLKPELGQKIDLDWAAMAKRAK